MRMITAALSLAAFAAAAGAQDDAPPIIPDRDPWTVKFEPAAWYVAANGSVRLPGSAGAGNGASFTVDDLNLDSPRVSPLGEFQLRRGDWRIQVGSVGFSTDDRGALQTSAGQIGDAAFAAGDTLRSAIDLYSFAADGAYAFHTFASGELRDGGAKFRSTLLGVGGVRALSVDVSTQVFAPGPGATAGGDAFGAHPYAGLRWEMDIWEDFSVDVVGTLGGMKLGETESWSSDIIVGFQWNPTPHFGAQVGYRQLLFGVETDSSPGEFAWQGGLAGLYAGAVLRF